MTRRRWIVAVAALVLLLAAGAAAAAYVVWQQRHPGTIRGSSTIEFETTEEPGATTRPEEVVRKVPWPTYGYDEQRSRYAPGFDVRPPFTTTWEKGTGSLLEFPPVVAYGRVYVGTNDGRFLAVKAETGKVVWQKNFARCIAASPAIGEDVIYQPLMDPFPCREHKQDAAGYMVALDPDTGKELWRFDAQRGIMAGPVTFRAGGEQYVAVLAGYGGSMGMATQTDWMRRPPPNGMLLAFRIGGTGTLAKLPPVEPRPYVTSSERFTPAQLAEGEAQYFAFCTICHNGPVNPDLTHSPVAANAEAWRSVVFDGALAENGMIGFKPWLTAGQIEAIRGYVLTEAARRRAAAN